jgi:hypothetical protein
VRKEGGTSRPYKITAPIGEGGMDEVDEVTDLATVNERIVPSDPALEGPVGSPASPQFVGTIDDDRGLIAVGTTNPLSNSVQHNADDLKMIVGI